MEIFPIVITGGPCGGKTTAMQRIRCHFEGLGYGVVTVPETATELILSGISPFTLPSSFVYQGVQLRLQKAKEEIYRYGASLLGRERVLLVFDRGMLDNRAYLAPEEFSRAVRDAGLAEETLCDRYLAVFHLVTAADGAMAFYTLGNNSARSESPQAAIAVDQRLRECWKKHPKHFLIPNESGGFEEKMQTLLSKIQSVLPH